jgi:hypothetical protein
MAVVNYAANATRYLGIVIIFTCSTTIILFLLILESISSDGDVSTSLEAIQRKGIVALDVYIPQGRKDDTFVNVSMVLRLEILA